MSAVVGIDLSSFAVDLVKLDEDSHHAEWTRVELTGKLAFDRLRSLRAAMPPASFWDDVYLVGIEQVFGLGGKSTTALQRVYGAVVACVPVSVQLWEVHPSEWRKSLGLAGNASKDECARAVIGLIGPSWPHLGCPQDPLDAYAIAYSARETNAKAIQAATAA
jgi:Holliday junction resolvasome RuvABC endonuclease subunit